MSIDSVSNGLAPEGHSPKTILDLPREILWILSRFVTLPKDLHSMCLVNRSFRDWAIPDLYTTILISVDKLNVKLEKSLNPKNQNLRHTRHLYISETLKPFERKLHEVYLLRLLQVLPEHTLQQAFIDSPSEMSSEVDRQLYRTQNKLQMLVLHSNISARMPFKLAHSPIQSLASLALFIKTLQDVKRYTGLIQALPNLKDLRIAIMSHFLPQDNRRWPVSSARVFQALLSQNTAPSSHVPKLALRRLCLDGFNFVDSDSAFVDRLDLHHLQELALLACTGTWKVAERLSHHQVNLRTFIQDRFENWSPVGAPTERFLRSFKGLRVFESTYEPQDFTQDGDSKGLPWSAFQNHCNTLEILHLDDALIQEDAWNESHRTMADFKVLCTGMSRLKQLGIRPPHKSAEDVMAFLDCLKKVERIASLKLYLSSVSSTPLTQARLDAKMKEIATTILGKPRPHCPLLTALVLSIDPTQVQQPRDEHAFLRCCSYDWGGKAVVTAQPVDIRDLQYHQPESDIFYEYNEYIWSTKKPKGGSHH